MTGTRGPKSKPDAARRNAPKGKTQLEGAPAVIPAQPELKTAEARDWWDSLVSSPWAKELTATDWQTARRGAKLVDLFWTEPTSQLAGEIRQIEAKLGMTVADRDRLGWNIVPPPDEGGDTGATATPSRRRPDPRKP